MKKYYNKIKFTIAFLGVMAFLFSQTRLDDNWKISEAKNRRSPAAISIFKNRDPQLYQDYFSHNHKMEVEFWTDKDEESIRKRARLALHTAISNTLLNKENGAFSKQIFKQNLIESFTGHFLKSLYLLKIVNGTFQVDLHFSPSEMDTFSKLMDTNQLVDSHETGTLLAKLAKDKVKFEDKLLARKGQDSNRYENLGGTITFWFKILDLNWNPLNPIPNPPKNAVKGMVKYRRFFRMNQDWTPSLKLKNPSRKLTASWKKEDASKVITVDVTKRFNLENLVPTPEKVEIHFGKVKFPKHYKTGSLHNMNPFTKDSKHNKLLLSGKHEDQEYSFELKKLEFLLDKNEFGQNSSLKSHGNWSGFNIGQKRKFKSEVRHSLLGDDALNFIKSFNLDRFHHNFKEVGSM